MGEKMKKGVIKKIVAGLLLSVTLATSATAVAYKAGSYDIIQTMLQ